MGNIRMISHSGKPFRDRQEAGQLLGEALADLRGENPVVLGIPRGGVVVANELARALEGDLDIVLSRKLRTPGHQELAMGSVAEGGKLFLNEMVIRELGVGESYIEQQKERQLKEIERRAGLIRQFAPRVALKGRVVVVTDDGVATGATAQAALWSARHEQPGRLIAAFPVASEEAIKGLSEDVDEIVCLRVPPFFAAVGQFYLHFEEVMDEDVLAILKESARTRTRE